MTSVTSFQRAVRNGLLQVQPINAQSRSYARTRRLSRYKAVKMKRLLLPISAAVAGLLASCSTPAGTGAAAGAATGAVVGGPVGAAVGAGVGALVGVGVEETRAAEYGPAPRAGYPRATSAGRPGMYYSPYTHKVYNLRGIPHGGLVRDQDTNQLFRKP